ncbi:MAG: AAA family ATPase [Burkholderiaceae bacterium]|jgi:hypothetical protein|nr:AAA family ATPase [Burkholderiaceae bacterium]
MPSVLSLADHAALVAALRRVLGADALIETHISSVLLAGDCAYKLKKPVDFGFVDFSTRDLRAHFCAEELRLNRRTAPQLYLDVQPVAGTLEAPQVGGPGEPIDHLLRMRRFDPAHALDQAAARDELTAAHIDALATAIADLHRTAACAADDSPFGTPATVQRWVDGNLEHVRADCHAAIDRARVDALAVWTRHRFERQCGLIESRRRAGFVREGHGDLHLGNVVLIDGRPVLFDALEFNPELRWIDVVSDVAFLFMDLLDHGHSALAWRMLSGYLEATGDYDGVALLHYYAVYRALVRAKVALLRVQQPMAAPIVRVRAQRTFAHYLALAEGLAQARQSPQLIVMTGLSGSGKSTVALELAALLGALRVRSDVERKRLAGMTATARGADTLYAPRMTELTYERLQLLAATLLEARVSVVVDAASLRADERRGLARIAAARGCQATVVACEAPPAVLDARVAARAAAGRDPSDATLEVLARQRLWQEPRAPDEPPHRRIDTDCAPAELTARCAALARQLLG